MKGPYRIRVVIEINNTKENIVDNEYKQIDEIKTYLNYRYITPYEVVWRLFEYPIIEIRLFNDSPFIYQICKT